MADFTIQGFPNGMDDRRPTWAALASSVTLGKDVVLNEGGDLEVRKAFVAKYTVPASTFGLTAVGDELYVFGTVAAPAVPTGVNYQQLVPSDGEHIESILSDTQYDGHVYLSALMSDATRRHFYNGTEVADWFDGRARGQFQITGGSSGGVTRIDVNGVDVLGATVNWATSHVATAAAIAAQINSYASTPNYSAEAIGDTVVVQAEDGVGSAANGYVLAVTVSGTTTVSVLSDLAGGVDNAPLPGAYVRTLDTKVYSPSGKLLNFSGIDGPTAWNTDSDGAGFSDLSRTESGSETLMSIESFLKEAVVFAQGCAQVWHLAADDVDNARLQTFEDVGTLSVRSSKKFRETDVFFHDRYRGMLAIVPSGTNDTFARIDDVGLPINKTLKAYQKTLSAAVVAQGLAFVEPGSSRFWQVLGNRVFVYSYYPKDQIEGWTYFDVGFQIEYAAVVGGRLYVRSANTIYLYGGDNDDEYPEADVGQITFAAFRASAPARVKAFKGIDFGVEGTWQAWLYADERDTVGREIARPHRATFSDGDVPMSELGPNPILKLVRKNTGYARVCSLMVNYTPA